MPTPNPAHERINYDKFEFLRSHRVINQELINFNGIGVRAPMPNRSHDDIYAEWIMWSEAERSWVIVTSGREAGVEWWDGHADHPVYTFEHRRICSATGLLTRVMERYHVCQSCPGGVSKDHLYLAQLVVIDETGALDQLSQEHYTELVHPIRIYLPERVLFRSTGDVRRLTQEF